MILQKTALSNIAVRSSLLPGLIFLEEVGGDVAEPKILTFWTSPHQPSYKNPILAPFIAKSGPLGRFEGCVAAPWLRACITCLIVTLLQQSVFARQEWWLVLIQLLSLLFEVSNIFVICVKHM